MRQSKPAQGHGHATVYLAIEFLSMGHKAILRLPTFVPSEMITANCGVQVDPKTFSSIRPLPTV